MKTILISAYAVNPYKGSEDGMGWNFICQAARFNKVIAVTRENNQPHIERFISENPSEVYTNISFLYYDLAYWMRFWKRKQKGALLYFYLWQLLLPRFVKKQNVQFDIAHNLNFHNDWTPSRLNTLGKPLVWGPIGHHPRIPKQFVLPVYGWKNHLTEQLRWFTKKLFWSIDPFLKHTLKKADAVLCMNSDVSKIHNLKNKNCFTIPSVASEHVKNEIKNKDEFIIISAGRFVSLKGFDITVRAYANFIHRLKPEEKKKTKLILVGQGPQKKLLETIIRENQIEEYVEFIDWIERKELFNLYSKCSAFLFPSHEGAGMVVSEALSFGLPVICFDNSGPGEFVNATCGIKIPYGQYYQTVRNFGDALFQLHADKDLLQQLSLAAIIHHKNNFDWNIRGEQLKNVYESVSKNKTKEKIVCAHLLNDYSGSPLVLSNAIKGLVQAGYEVDLFTSGNREGFLSKLPVNNYSFFYKFFENKYLRLLVFSISQFHLFFKTLKYWNKPVTFYINTLLPCGAALAGWLMRKKVIYHLHETSINPPAFKKFLRSVATTTASKAIYVSNYLMKTELLQGVVCSVVYNALPDEFVKKAQDYRLHPQQKNTFTVLMLCSLKVYKGVREFVELAKRIPHINFELVLNAELTEINKFFEKEILPSNLKIFPTQKNVHPFYERASLVVNLSHPDKWVETFGMTLLEAMCYGIPVIAPPVGGPVEIVKQNINGFLKEPTNRHDLMNTINHVYDDKNICRRLSEQAVKTAETFRIEQMQMKVVEIMGKNDS